MAITPPSQSRDSASLAPAQDVEPEPSSGARPIIATLAQRYLDARARRARAEEELQALGAQLMNAMTVAHVERVEPIAGVNVCLVVRAARVTVDRAPSELTIERYREALDEAARLLEEHGIRYEAPPLPARLSFKTSRTTAPFLLVRSVPGDSAPPTRATTTRELA